ncbi:MAG: CHRD domain-containing protein [Gammaproteobacteria bacterium]
MNRLSSVVVVTAFLLLTSMPSFAHTVPGGTEFAADLSGGQEVTTVSVVGADGKTPVAIVNGPVATGAFGMVHVKLAQDRQSLEFRLHASNFGTPVLAAHIHLGPKGANGPVLITLFSRASQGDFPGMLSGVLTAANVEAKPGLGVNTLEDVINNIFWGNAYVNVHSQTFPGGEIRGQLKRRFGKDKD